MTPEQTSEQDRGASTGPAPLPECPTFLVRPADPHDVPELLRLVRALAHYEKDPEAAVATPEQFTRALFPADGAPVASAHVAVLPDGPVVGMALWFTTFSTWTGQPGIWLEDLFVDPDARGGGIGTALLSELAATCVERGWTRLEWTVLDWNAPSIAFYRSHGAHPLDDWTTFRVDGDALTRLATA
ncbi:GNAT family N-acetyltransferase [Intrasporangium sp. YIM S08009]|uniref:GNAT family N-acetyltransferase n=1 Tax=Intrasporangium zincisolvens TaxID=3080018 RepID=UPI002B061EC9|nr:GNAT family N-acetyltransferase [Intrasporangium sp. YIM S08009]